MELDRDYILKEFLRLISHISDKEFQMRVWIKGIGPECIDFDETCDHFFIGGVDVIKNYKDYGITEHQEKLLTSLEKIFDAFLDDHLEEPIEFINTQEWQRVVDEAKKVLEAFNYIRPDFQDLL